MKNKSFAVIGLGRFGSSLAVTLANGGHEVIGIDKDEQLVNDLNDKLTHTLIADCTDEDVLRAIGIRNFDVAIVAIGNDIQASIMAALQLKEIGVRMVVAKAMSETHGKVLQKIGVDKVVYPERDMGVRVANQLVSPNLLDIIELSDEYSIAEIAVPEKINGKTLLELDPRRKYGCSVVAINKSSGVVIAPTANDQVHTSDVMVIIGSKMQLEAFEKEVID